MRRCWLLLLCLALPLQGWAQVASSAPPCPLSSTMLAQIVEAAERNEALPDCCNDLAGYLLTGQTCDGARVLSTPAAGWLQALQASLPEGAGLAPAWQHRPELPPPNPEHIWRPPALR